MALLRSPLSTNTDPVIYGDTVLLRQPQMADYAEWAELRELSRNFLAPWEPLWLPDELTRTAFRRRVRHYIRELQEESGYAFFLFRASDQTLLGGLTLSNVRRGVTQAGTLGYWVGQPYAGRGYMSAGVRALLPFVFETLRLHRLEAACLLNNEASIRLLEHAGFQREGIARRYLKIGGAWQDHLLYALLDTDPIG